MARYSASRVLLALLLALLVGVAAAGPTDAHRGDGKRRVWRVVKEHLDALNACDIRRLMAQHPPSVTFFGTGGYVARGRDDVEGMYKAFCKRDGLAPFRFKVLEAHRLGSTLFVRYRFTSPKLTRPYVGSDAYGTRGDKLVRIVSTFDKSELKTRD
ncbi:hypothetical protein I4F81_011304 [Pyropia yezoensis]|uniref:Uncharacterized protein n=1 Tax=Pyropia yezoensis TaxID=2788 RepID=A0ACC3CGB7_PYRYE|nr:hypothetical protein I4F81_011304 [Neopyropia yezoensis]|eukprot:contig_21815_g5384